VRLVVTRDEYFAAAMSMLAVEGHSALKISKLCKRIGVTTGSFYNYFGSLDGFVDALLENWEAEQTIRIVALATVPKDPVERMHRMKELALTIPHDAEAGIRGWSKSNAAVAVAQKRVDAEREAALREVIVGIVPNGPKSDLLALIGVTLLVGLQQWRTPIDLREVAQVFDEFEAVLLKYANEYAVHPIDR
jgi:AcrR family transcriptional regulator